MELLTVKMEKPDEINLILGQSHFIKTVEDLHEALVTCVGGIKFGLAFCEASGPCLGPQVRDPSVLTPNFWSWSSAMPSILVPDTPF